MADYTAEDCLARAREHAQLPETDESMTDAAWYALLSTAQRKWQARIAAVYPSLLWEDPVLLQTDDGGVTYHFGTDGEANQIVPVGQVALFRTEDDAKQPAPAAVYALRPGIDFRHEGWRVRLSPTSPLSLPDGAPWARFITPAGPIDGSNDPVLLPVLARELIVLDAVATWAAQGGLRDPAPFLAQINDLWMGAPGAPGLLATLKTQYFATAPSSRRGAISGYVYRRPF